MNKITEKWEKFGLLGDESIPAEHKEMLALAFDEAYICFYGSNNPIKKQLEVLIYVIIKRLYDDTEYRKPLNTTHLFKIVIEKFPSYQKAYKDGIMDHPNLDWQYIFINDFCVNYRHSFLKEDELNYFYGGGTSES